MPDIRHFGPATKHVLARPGAHGLAANMIQLPQSVLAQLSEEQLAERYAGRPIVLNQPTTVVALYLDAPGMMDEHDAPHDILFIVIGGSGFVRVGSAEAATLAVTAGDAIHWPPHVLHQAWTTDTPMHAITIEYRTEGD